MAQGTDITLQESAVRYPIRIGAGLLVTVGTFLRETLPRTQQVLVVSDVHVAPLYLEPLKQALVSSGIHVHQAVIEPGEDHKTMATVEQLYDAALSYRLKRNDAVVALGGGIVGDLAGFFAATYFRGIPFIQVPTTLLAQVDSSVGGKTGINWHGYKNQVGAFYHPHGVLIDTETLKTLPSREFACGMAEVIKYAFLALSVPGASGENPLLEHLESVPDHASLDLETVILTCCKLKAAVVEADPEERLGIREFLNLGHTFAHAYETLSDGDIPHGEAVGMGMVNAFTLAQQSGQIAGDAVDRLQMILRKFDLPTRPLVSFDPAKILETMKHDKKAVGSETYRLVLPYDNPGKVRVQDGIAAQQVRSALSP